MTMHEEWTDKLSDYLDGELTAGEAAAVDAHLRACAACTAVLNDLKRVVNEAKGLEARRPAVDLWPGVAARIGAKGTIPFEPRKRAAQFRVSFTLTQLAAAAAVVMAISGTVVWQLAQRSARASRPVDATAAIAAPAPDRGQADTTPDQSAHAAVLVSLADDQYDAAVADLEKALRAGRGRLDKSTIDIVEHNLQIIDQAIAQARDALAADPANTYLSGHLVEARRRKLDLLRRAAALADSD
jgi:hypothetical protein